MTLDFPAGTRSGTATGPSAASFSRASSTSDSKGARTSSLPFSLSHRRGLMRRMWLRAPFHRYTSVLLQMLTLSGVRFLFFTGCQSAARSGQTVATSLKPVSASLPEQ